MYSGRLRLGIYGISMKNLIFTLELGITPNYSYLIFKESVIGPKLMIGFVLGKFLIGHMTRKWVLEIPFFDSKWGVQGPFSYLSILYKSASFLTVFQK